MKELLRSDNPQIIAEIFLKGGIVVFPTDTVWGIGCIYNNKESIKRLYCIKKRQPDKPTSLLVPDISWLSQLADITKDQVSFISSHWPGALTVVVPAKKEIAKNAFVSETSQVGIRLPSHKSLLEVLSIIKTPILGPSANFASQTPPTKISQLDPKLLELVDAVFIAKNGHGKESTVISLENKKITIIRDGAVKI